MQAYKYNHAYFEIKGKPYYDYSLLGYGMSIPGDEYMIIDGHLFNKLSEIKTFLSPIKPAKGSSLWMAPGYPFAIADIRRNYEIKRTPDTADYNVFSNVTEQLLSGHSCTYYKQVIVIPSEKLLVIGLHNEKESDLVRKAEEFLGKIIGVGDYIYEECNPNISWDSMSCTLLPHTYLAPFLLGTYKKPCVYVKNLDLTTGNELNLDLLKLFYAAAKTPRYEPDAKKNCLIQMNVLNQHNWRDYPGTISAINSCLDRNYVSVYKDTIKRRLSQQSKPIREIIETTGKPFANEMDLKMAQEFFKDLLHITDVKFTTLMDLDTHLYTNCIDRSLFFSMFDNIIRITPKEYKEENEAGD